MLDVGCWMWDVGCWRLPIQSGMLADLGFGVFVKENVVPLAGIYFEMCNKFSSFIFFQVKPDKIIANQVVQFIGDFVSQNFNNYDGFV